VHLKDLNEFGIREAFDVPFGTGVSDIPGVLAELDRQEFQGNLSIEYENHWERSVPEVAQCIGFVRGYGARRPVAPEMGIINPGDEKGKGEERKQDR
jgi:sugar phosphate isomerase/epimerase